MGRGLKRFFELMVPAALVVFLLASSWTPASATIVTMAGDSAVGKNSLAMPGSQDILKDALGKYVAVYVDVGGNLSVAYANGDPTQAGAWSAPAKSPMPIVAYRRPAAVFTSPVSMRVIAEGGPAAGALVDVPMTLSRDLTNANNIQANVIERPDNVALLLVGNRGERSNETTLVFNSASYNGIGWAWGTQNLAYETEASRGLSDATDLAWDPVRSVVVATYDISRTSRYGIIQIDASGSKVHADTPDLKLTNNEWGVLEVDPQTGDYYLFTMDTPLSPPWGQEYGNVTYTRRSNGFWSATLTLIDGGIDNMGISPLRPTLGTGGDGAREIVYAKGKTAPATLNFVRLSP